MQEVETYRRYAKECTRLARKAKPGDKEALLKIAEAWERQARIAEDKKKSNVATTQSFLSVPTQ